jgi:hypothetical protein
MVSIAAKFPISRRRETLSWSHHADIAALPAAEQDAWLDRAAKDQMSVQDLRKAIRLAKPSSSRASASSGAEAPLPFVCTHCGRVSEIDRAELNALFNAGAS